MQSSALVRPLSRLLSPLSRQNTPSSSSIDLLVNHGYIKQASSGIFDLLPLGTRVQQKITAIVRKHLNANDCTELELATLVQPQLWKDSGRLKEIESDDEHAKTASEFIFTTEKKHLLAPTAEEQITTLVGSVSYKQLPLSLYQITKKYRNELRPRGGLLRTREFLMKDLYTFDVDAAAAKASYERIRKAYHDIFNEIGVPYLEATADSGDMGGELSHEYHYVHPLGEDSVISCSSCGYAANIEKAISHGAPVEEMVIVEDNIKIPKGRTLNPNLVKDARKAGKPLVDCRIDPEHGSPLVEPVAGDNCVNCGSELRVDLSIEVGHTFYLSDRYTKPLKANVLPASGKPYPMEMGCYGIGISRIIAAVASKHSDEHGLVWPKAIAPFQCCVVSKNVELSAEIAAELSSIGVDVTYEDRTTQLGQAMRAARESGFPLTVVLGKSWEQDQLIELLPRVGGPSMKVTRAGLLDGVRELLA